MIGVHLILTLRKFIWRLGLSHILWHQIMKYMDLLSTDDADIHSTVNYIWFYTEEWWHLPIWVWTQAFGTSVQIQYKTSSNQYWKWKGKPISWRFISTRRYFYIETGARWLKLNNKNREKFVSHFVWIYFYCPKNTITQWVYKQCPHTT